MTAPKVVYSDDEQIKLADLSKTLEEVEMYKGLIIRSSFKGDDCMIVTQMFNHFESIRRQLQTQMNNIKSEATNRAAAPSEPTLVAVEEVPKTKKSVRK
jgi:hypothetical protein